MPSPVLQLRIRQELLDAVDAAAKGAGMDRKVWVVQALEAALSEAKGTAAPEQAGPAPVSSSGDVRPAASPRAPKPVRLNVARTLLREAGAYKPIQRRDG